MHYINNRNNAEKLVSLLDALYENELHYIRKKQKLAAPDLPDFDLGLWMQFELKL